MPVSPPVHPVQVDLDAPLAMERWRPFVNWLLAVPHWLVVYALTVLRNALLVVAFFTVLFTESIPRPIVEVVAMTYRYQWRVVSYALFLREAYPPFDFTPATGDDGRDPAVYAIEEAARLDRWKPLYKWLLAIPHVIVLTVLGMLAAVVVAVAAFAVLTTGEYPRPLRDIVVGVARWELRVEAYILFLTDEYPPFTLHATAPGPASTAGPLPTA